ncbi:MAG: hypothetical protein PHV25_00015 [Candidatus Pacebacteria bacterium]|nr:hypothetical protein [Candidatus Paceibacterota bacterium]
MEAESSAPSAPPKGFLEEHWKILLIAAAVVVIGGIILLGTFGGAGGEERVVDVREEFPVIVESQPPRSWGETLTLAEGEETFEVFLMEAFCLEREDITEVLVPLEKAGKNPTWVYPQGQAQVGGEVVGVITPRPTSWVKIQQVSETDKVFATYWTWLTGVSQEEVASYILLEQQGWEVSWTFPEGKVQLVPRNRGTYLLGTQVSAPVCTQPPATQQQTQPPVTQPAQPGITDIQSVSPGEARVWAMPPFKVHWEDQSGSSWGDFFEVTSGGVVSGETVMVFPGSGTGSVRPVLVTPSQTVYGEWV